jgi:hypothetical protein
VLYKINNKLVEVAVEKKRIHYNKLEKQDRIYMEELEIWEQVVVLVEVIYMDKKNCQLFYLKIIFLIEKRILY